jgi:hypothetical protein
MKFIGDRLQTVLRGQFNTVALVESDGRETFFISPTWAAKLIAGREFIGYGKDGAVEIVRAVDAPTVLPWKVQVELACESRGKHRRVGVTPNRGAPGRKTWIRRPDKARTGHAGENHTIETWTGRNRRR